MANTSDNRWITEAKKEVGVKERGDGTSEPRILKYWHDIGHADVNDESIFWCAAFVGAMLTRANIQPSGSWTAKSYLDWGVELDTPASGCVVVLDRNCIGETGFYHVGFVVDITATHLHVLGGKQHRAVNTLSFSLSRVAKGGYRWPLGVPRPTTKKAERPVTIT